MKRIRIDRHFENEKTTWKPYFMKRWSGEIWIFCWLRRTLVIDFRNKSELSELITEENKIYLWRKN